MMARGAELWEGIGRPLDAAISDLLLGHVLCEQRPGRGREVARAAAAEFERLGVAHLAECAKTVGLKPAHALCQTFRMPIVQHPDGVELHWEERGEGPLVVVANQFFAPLCGVRGPARPAGRATIGSSPTTRAGSGARRAQGPYDDRDRRGGPRGPDRGDVRRRRP